MEQDDSINGNKYRVISVDKTEPPAGMKDDKWYRYVIGQGTSRLEGTRQGTLNTVTRHAEEFAQNLNERKARGYSTYSPRKQTK